MRHRRHPFGIPRRGCVYMIKKYHLSARFCMAVVHISITIDTWVQKQNWYMWYFLWDEIALKYNSGVLNKMHWDKRMDYQSWILRWFHDIRDHTRRYTPMYSYLDSMLKMNRCILLEVKSDTLVLFNICTNYHHTVILIKISIHYDADVFGSNMYYIVWFIRCRDHYGYGFDQWEKALHSNAISHWWSPYTELSLRFVINHGGYHVKYDKFFSISNQTVSHTHHSIASTIDTLPETRCRHQMETFSALLTICVGNPSVTGGFPSQRPVTRSFDVSFELCLNKWLSKQWRRRWFKTPSRLLWRHFKERNRTQIKTQWDMSLDGHCW